MNASHLASRGAGVRRGGRHGATWLLLASVAVAQAAELPPGTKDERDVVGEARVYHIVLHDEGAARSLRDRLVAAAPNGVTAEQFKRAATAESRDPGSAPAGGDLGVVREGVMVAEFERAMLQADLRQVFGPVRTGFGWHLLYVTSRVQIPAARLCASTLAAALRSAGAERDVLEFSGRARSAEAIHPQVLRWLGAGWDAPRLDERGDPVYWRTEPMPGRLGVVRLTQHVEYGSALYQGHPEGCRRSARDVWEVRCAEQTIALVSTTAYEGRAGHGRRLYEWQVQPTTQRVWPARDGLARQMHTRACRAAPGVPMRLRPA